MIFKLSSAFAAFLFCCLPLLVFAQEMTEAEFGQQIRQHRAETRERFADKDSSPLKPRDLKKFDGLNYFPPDFAYRVRADFVKSEKPDTVTFETTQGEREYAVYGKLSFEIDGQACELTAYQDLRLVRNPVYQDYLFVPFADKTNAQETYGGGRYLDFGIKEAQAETVWLDFNKAYNPYCAYNDAYDCPLVPLANRLKVEVRAGEKNWKK